MNKIQCIMLEDEKPAQEVISSFISRVDWLELKGTFGEALGALEFLKTHEVDLIFLDIQIPGVTGIDFLKVLRHPPAVIITSAYSQFALEAFELDVRDYLMKPFAFERFLKAVNKISPRPDPSQVYQMTMPQPTPGSFAFFNVNKRMVRVQFADILYVESLREYICIHTAAEKVITKLGIGETEKILGAGFLRIHRSFIVQMARVTAFTSEEVFMGKEMLPIGPNYKRAVENAFGKRTEDSKAGRSPELQ